MAEETDVDELFCWFGAAEDDGDDGPNGCPDASRVVEGDFDPGDGDASNARLAGGQSLETSRLPSKAPLQTHPSALAWHIRRASYHLDERRSSAEISMFEVQPPWFTSIAARKKARSPQPDTSGKRARRRRTKDHSLITLRRSVS